MSEKDTHCTLKQVRWSNLPSARGRADGRCAWASDRRADAITGAGRALRSSARVGALSGIAAHHPAAPLVPSRTPLGTSPRNPGGSALDQTEAIHPAARVQGRSPDSTTTSARPSRHCRPDFSSVDCPQCKLCLKLPDALLRGSWVKSGVWAACRLSASPVAQGCRDADAFRQLLRPAPGRLENVLGCVLWPGRAELLPLPDALDF